MNFFFHKLYYNIYFTNKNDIGTRRRIVNSAYWHVPHRFESSRLYVNLNFYIKTFNKLVNAVLIIYFKNWIIRDLN